MKKTICILTCVVLALALFGCGKKEPAPPAPNPQPPVADHKTETRIITLYYADQDVLYLHPENRTVDIKQGELERTVLEELFKGPESDQLLPAVSGEPEILSVQTIDGLCTIDLSEDFVQNNTGGTTRETFALYAIVNTLCDLDTVGRVKINIEGNEDYPFGGHMSLLEPFEPDENMIAP